MCHNDDLVYVDQTDVIAIEGDHLYSFTYSLDSARIEDGGKLVIKAENEMGRDECVAHIDVAEETRRSIARSSFFYSSLTRIFLKT